MPKLPAKLCGRNVVWIAPLLGMLLALPSLWGGWVIDDHFHRQVLMGSERLTGIVDSRLDLFRFFDGTPERTQRMLDLGVIPWWTVPTLRGAFWRPVAALTHWLDYALWPKSAPLMHLQSIVWYGFLIFTVALLYRRLMGSTPVAGICTLLFAIDDGHGMPVGFLANRNAVISAAFGVATLLFHDRWRRRGNRIDLALPLLAFSASLLSSEAGLSTTAYLFAYALFLERSPWRSRVLSLLPYAFLVLGWRWAWTIQGYGVSDGMSFYIDPLNSPIEFLAAMSQRLPLLLLGQWALPPSDLSVLLTPSSVGALSAVAMLVLLAIGWIVVTVLRSGLSNEGPSESLETRSTPAVLGEASEPGFEQAIPTRRLLSFATVGMFLSVLPPCATFPSDRLLLFVGLGAMILVVSFLTAVFNPPLPPESDEPTKNAGSEGRGEGGSTVAAHPASPLKGSGRFRHVLALSLAYVFVAIHGFIAPIGLSLRAAYPVGPPLLHTRLYVRTPFDESVTEQTVVLVNPPSVIHACYLPALRELAGEPVPKRVRALAPGLPSVTVRRIDAHTLMVRPERGYLNLFFDRLFRNERQPLSLGQKITLSGMTVEVTELTADNRPAAAAFHFDTPLEDHSLLWLYWTEGRFRPWSPPPIGETVELRPDPSGVEWLR